jgi:hypothetical protein
MGAAQPLASAKSLEVLSDSCQAAKGNCLLSVFAENKQICVDFHYSVGGCLARLLLDTGAGFSYVSSTFVTERGLAQSLSTDNTATITLHLAHVTIFLA